MKTRTLFATARTALALSASLTTCLLYTSRCV